MKLNSEEEVGCAYLKAVTTNPDIVKLCEQQVFTWDEYVALNGAARETLGVDIGDMGVICNTSDKLGVNGFIGVNTHAGKSQLVLSDDAFDVMMLSSLLNKQANGLLKTQDKDQWHDKVLVTTPNAEHQFALESQLNLTEDTAKFIPIDEDGVQTTEINIPEWRQSVLL